MKVTPEVRAPLFWSLRFLGLRFPEQIARVRILPPRPFPTRPRTVPSEDSYDRSRLPSPARFSACAEPVARSRAGGRTKSGRGNLSAARPDQMAGSFRQLGREECR